MVCYKPPSKLGGKRMHTPKHHKAGAGAARVPFCIERGIHRFNAKGVPPSAHGLWGVLGRVHSLTRPATGGTPLFGAFSRLREAFPQKLAFSRAPARTTRGEPGSCYPPHPPSPASPPAPRGRIWMYSIQICPRGAGGEAGEGG